MSCNAYKEDFTGRVFNSFTVLGPVGGKSDGTAMQKWRCRCKCGKICEKTGGELRTGSVKSCGCLRSSRRPVSGRYTHLEGQTFGLLTVLRPGREGQRGKHSDKWICQCECGNLKAVRGRDLVLGRVRSCGCAYPEHLPNGENQVPHPVNERGTRCLKVKASVRGAEIVFGSVREGALFAGLPEGQVLDACTAQVQAGGYSWKFVL